MSRDLRARRSREGDVEMEEIGDESEDLLAEETALAVSPHPLLSPLSPLPFFSD